MIILEYVIYQKIFSFRTMSIYFNKYKNNILYLYNYKNEYKKNIIMYIFIFDLYFFLEIFGKY